MRKNKKVILVSLLLLLSACVSTNPSGISEQVVKCCVQSDYQSFTVIAENIPAFLGPIMVSNFSVALAGKGLQPMVEGGDLNIILRFEQVDLTEKRQHDDFDERIAPGGDVRFIARIVVEMHDAKTDEIVWSGNIQRIHNVSPGEYMHTGPASVALLDAFAKLLEDYPGDANHSN